MIRVTLELIPGGIGKPEHLGTAYIANEGTGTKTMGSYSIILQDKAKRIWRTGWVDNFPRKRLLAWDLLYRALRQCVGERNEEESVP